MFRALDLRSQLYLGKKKLELALADVEQMLAHKPEQRCQISKVHANRAIIHHLMGDSTQAGKAIEQSLTYDINNISCHLTLLQDAFRVNDRDLFNQLVEKN